jgi:hypothetical protein
LSIQEVYKKDTKTGKRKRKKKKKEGREEKHPQNLNTGGNPNTPT